MKPLETSLKVIAQMGEEKEEENFDFRAFLKGQDSSRVDRVVYRLNKEISEKINCQECGNCCESLRPGVSNKEIKVLSNIEGISESEFIKKFVKKDEIEKSKYLREVPCRYLDGKSCSIYEKRPTECKTYPNTYKKDFIFRTYFIIENYSICPIVYNIYEQLKTELRYFR